MPLFQHANCDVLASITTKGFEFARDIAHEQGIDLGIALLGDKKTNPPSVILLDMPAGHILERHAHNTYRMEVVIKGSVITPDGRELGVGDVSMSAPGEFYGPLTAGSEGCMTVEIFADAGGLVPQTAEDSSAAATELIASIEKRTRAKMAE